MNYIEELRFMLNTIGNNYDTLLMDLAKRIINGTTLICGNGGSAADSQHLAAELVARFEKERKAIPAIALSTDTSILTAISNDYSYDKIFSRQVEAYNADVLIIFSTSGNSKNCIEAAKAAKSKGMYVFGFLGKEGGELKYLCDDSIVIPGFITSHIQECHMVLYHYLCKLVECLFD